MRAQGDDLQGFGNLFWLLRVVDLVVDLGLACVLCLSCVCSAWLQI